MQIHFCTDALFLKKHKDRWLKENVVLLEKDFFYEIDAISYPESLIRLKEYLPYIQKIWIYIDFSMVSFVNLIILGDYFYSHQYQQELQIVYYQKETGAILFEKNILDASLGVSFFQGKKYLQNQQIQDEMFKLKPFIPHFKECLRLYSLIRFDKLAFKMILQTCLQNDLEMEPEQYFMKTYPNFGLKEDYIQKLFLDVKEESK